MATTDIIALLSELSELEELIEQAKTEAEAIRDSIKAEMTACFMCFIMFFLCVLTKYSGYLCSILVILWLFLTVFCQQNSFFIFLTKD